MWNRMIQSRNRYEHEYEHDVSPREQRILLEKCARTTLSSKLIARQREFFAKMVVDAVLILDELLPLNMWVKTSRSDDQSCALPCP